MSRYPPISLLQSQLEIDDTVDDYVDRILFTLTSAIEEHQVSGQWFAEIILPLTTPPRVKVRGTRVLLCVTRRRGTRTFQAWGNGNLKNDSFTKRLHKSLLPSPSLWFDFASSTTLSEVMTGGRFHHFRALKGV
ncbi:hypothetical protein M5K25_021445 [Dendrobium thyrsiflorum]|uniref:Uncharacterized protein n=1 Tax=Dendrobium thyrsiflorum TaxID=117978 RepID=A0ABD0UD78_DENTH